MIVTIDGPAGSGKSTAARKLAARLEIPYLDTGAMYRAIALAAQQLGVDLGDPVLLLETAKSVNLELDCGPTHTRIRLNGHDVTEAVRTLGVSAATPFVARHPGIRTFLIDRQRHIGRGLGSFVSEGRDQGSTVFPGADVKFVLDASLLKRAQRRFQELLAEDEKVEIEAVMQNLQSRDAIDVKQWEPLLVPGRAVVIDTTNLAISEVIDQMASVVAEVGSSPPKP